MSRPASSKPAAPLLAKPPCKIHPSAVVAERAQLTGTHSIEIGENSIIHPYAKIKANHGTVVIGKNTTISEKAVIGVEGGGNADITIGDNVDIQTGVILEAADVGDGSVVEVNALIGVGAVIGKHCKITPLSRIEPGEDLPDYTVVYGDNKRRKDTTLASHPEVREAKQFGHEKHVEVLKKLIPNASAKWQ